MNSVLESSYAWTGSFVEALTALTCDIASIIIESLGLTSNGTNSTVDSSSSSGSSGSGDGVPASATGERPQSKGTQVSKEADGFFAVDDFQLLLLEVFLAILFVNVCLVYIAWYFYGERITKQFMTPNSGEELKKAAAKLKLPQEHCQRYS